MKEQPSKQPQISIMPTIVEDEKTGHQDPIFQLVLPSLDSKKVKTLADNFESQFQPASVLLMQMNNVE